MRNSQTKRQRGFTLLELLMVVIIIGILAALALPQYLKTAERSRMSEALTILGAIRSSEIRYFAEHAAYADDLQDLDFDPASIIGAPFFTYADPTGGATFKAEATRNNLNFSTASGCTAGYKLSIDQAGVIDGQDCQ